MKQVNMTPSVLKTVNLSPVQSKPHQKTSPTRPILSPQAVNKNTSTILIPTAVPQTPVQNKGPVYQLVNINIGGTVKQILVPVQQVTKSLQQINVVHQNMTSPNASVKIVNSPFSTQGAGVSLIKVSPTQPKLNLKIAVDPIPGNKTTKDTSKKVNSNENNDGSDTPLCKIDSVYSLHQDSDSSFDNDDQGRENDTITSITSPESDSDVIRGESHQVLAARHAVQQLMFQVRHSADIIRTDNLSSREEGNVTNGTTNTVTCSEKTSRKSEGQKKQNFSLKSLSSQFTALLREKGSGSTFILDENISNDDLLCTETDETDSSEVIPDASNNDCESDNAESHKINVNETEAITRPVFPSTPVFPEPELMASSNNASLTLVKTKANIDENKVLKTTPISQNTVGHIISPVNVGDKHSKLIKQCSVPIEKLNIGDKVSVNINVLHHAQKMKRMRRKRNVSWLYQEDQLTLTKRNNKDNSLNSLNEKESNGVKQLEAAHQKIETADKNASHSQKNKRDINESIDLSISMEYSDENVIEDSKTKKLVAPGVMSKQMNTAHELRGVISPEVVQKIKSTFTDEKAKTTKSPTDEMENPPNHKDKARANLHNILQNMVNHGRANSKQSSFPLTKTGEKKGQPQQETTVLKSNIQKRKRLYSSADTVKRTILPDTERPPQQVILVPVSNNQEMKSKETTKEKVVQIVRPDGSREHVKLTEWLGNKSAILREGKTLIGKPTSNNVSLIQNTNKIVYRFTPSNTRIDPPKVPASNTPDDACQERVSKREPVKKPSESTSDRISKLKAQLAEQEQALEKIRNQRQQSTS